MASVAADLEAIELSRRATVRSAIYSEGHHQIDGLTPELLSVSRSGATKPEYEEDDKGKLDVVPGDNDGEGATLVDEESFEAYSKFSVSIKRRVVFIVAFSALALEFSLFAFLPSINAICRALDTTPAIVNITIAIFVLTLAVAPLYWSAYSSIYGKRAVYLVANPCYALGSLGVALSTSLAALICARVVQAIGASCMMSVGASSKELGPFSGSNELTIWMLGIADVYHPKERGTAMSWYMLGLLMGPACSPVIAGVLEEYVPNEFGWRELPLSSLNLTCSRRE